MERRNERWTWYIHFSRWLQVFWRMEERFKMEWDSIRHQWGYNWKIFGRIRTLKVLNLFKFIAR